MLVYEHKCLISDVLRQAKQTLLFGHALVGACTRPNANTTLLWTLQRPRQQRLLGKRETKPTWRIKSMNKAKLLQVLIYHLSGALIGDPFLYPEVETGARCCGAAGAGEEPLAHRRRRGAGAGWARPAGPHTQPRCCLQARRAAANASQSRAAWRDGKGALQVTASRTGSSCSRRWAESPNTQARPLPIMLCYPRR